MILTSVMQPWASQGAQFSLLPCGRLMKPLFHCLSWLPTTNQRCGQWPAGQSQPTPAAGQVLAASGPGATLYLSPLLTVCRKLSGVCWVAV